MIELIIADTGLLIALARTNLLPQLAYLLKKVIIPESVFQEACADMNKSGAKAIFELEKVPWFTRLLVPPDIKANIKMNILDKGETEVILLAKELNCVALIDEKTGRRVAKTKGVKCIGTAAILLQMKQAGIVDEVTPLLKQLADSGYRLSPALIHKMKNLANE